MRLKSFRMILLLAGVAVLTAGCAAVDSSAQPADETYVPIEYPAIYYYEEPVEHEATEYYNAYNGYVPYEYELYYEEIVVYYYDVDYGYELAEEQDESVNISHLTEARVTRVVDGDTIVLYTGERVRLIGVDAPEVGDPGGAEATAFVSERVLNQTVWLESDGDDTDRFGRLRRFVWLYAPTDSDDREQIQRYKLNALLLSYGLAEVLIIGNVRNADLFREIAQPLVYATMPEQAGIEEETTADYAFIGNRNSEIFHRPTCGTLPAEHNRVHFETREQAIAAGHRPCRRCNP